MPCIVSTFASSSLNGYGDPLRKILLQHSNEQVVVLGGEHNGRHPVVTLIAARYEQRAEFPSVRFEQRADMLLRQHAGEDLSTSTFFRRRRRQGGLVVLGWHARGITSWLRPVLPLEVYLQRARQDDGTCELAGVLCDLVRRFISEPNGGPDDATVRGW